MISTSSSPLNPEVQNILERLESGDVSVEPGLLETEAVSLRWSADGIEMSAPEQLLLNADTLISVQLSRASRPQPRNWLQRLVRRPIRVDHILHAELRGQNSLRLRLSAMTSEESLHGLEHLDTSKATELEFGTLLQIVAVSRLLGAPHFQDARALAFRA